MFLWIGIAGASLIFIATLLIFVNWLKSNYARAGIRLLVLRQSRDKHLGMLALGTCLLILGSYLTSQNTVDRPNFFYPIIGGILSGYSGSLWLQFLCPLEFRERGIIVFGNLIEWSQIQNYEWHAKYLLIEYKHWIWHRKQKIRLSPTQKKAVKEIFKKRSLAALVV